MSAVDKIATKQVKEETYVDRMRKELEDLNKRAVSLAKFFHSDKYKELGYEKRRFLHEQFTGMQKYLWALSERIKLEERDVK